MQNEPCSAHAGFDDSACRPAQVDVEAIERSTKSVTDADKTPPPFDEQAALAELERLRAEIVQLRSKRVAADVAFDQFLHSLKRGEPAPDPATTAAVRPAVAATTVAAAVEAKPAEPLPAPSVDRAAAAVPAALVMKRQSGTSNLVIAGALLLLATGGVVTWTLRKNSREATAPQPIVAAQPPPASTSALSPSAPPIPASPYDSQITTIRAVWVRVVADGERVVERELPAQSRIPFRATKSVVIRTGDAGALRLSIGGRDQGPLGPDGVVMTRTFSVPQTR